MIVVCGGLMRTGSVAMWQIMREIVLKSGGKAPKLGTPYFDNIDKYLSQDHNTLIKTHDYNEKLDPAIEKKQIKVVVTIRDQRDVIVSLMNFNDYAFDTAIHARAFKGNVKNYYEWIEKIPGEDLLIVKYEDFIADRFSTIVEVADFLETDISDIEAREIDEKWNIEANRKRAKQRNKLDSINYMAERHINSGEARQWVGTLSKEQVNYIEQNEVVGPWLWQTGYHLHWINKALWDGTVYYAQGKYEEEE